MDVKNGFMELFVPGFNSVRRTCGVLGPDGTVPAGRNTVSPAKTNPARSLIPGTERTVQAPETTSHLGLEFAPLNRTGIDAASGDLDLDRTPERSTWIELGIVGE